MVGASLAVALAGLPLRVTLVEAIPAGTEGQPSFDARTTALSRSSQHILSTLGVWASIETEATAIRQIHVSELGRLGTAVLDAEEEGANPWAISWRIAYWAPSSGRPLLTTPM